MNAQDMAAQWLDRRADSYARDAATFRKDGVMLTEQDLYWAEVYQAVAGALRGMRRDIRRAESAAAKWRADEHTEEPTDEALSAAFARCVKPPKPELYPMIREQIGAWQ